MVVNVSHIQKLFDGNKVTDLKLDMTDPSSANALRMVEGSIDYQDHVDQALLRYLVEKQIEKISVRLDKEHLNLLRELFPGEYEPAQYEEIITEVEKHVAISQEMNKHTSKKRELILMQEIYQEENAAGRKSRLLFRQGSPIDLPMLKKIKDLYGESFKVQYNTNEEGILVYVNDPGKNISMKIDVLAVFAQSSIPVHVADTTDEAFSIFKNKKPKLILMTFLDNSVDSKDLFLRCIKEDPFLKFINYNKSPSAARASEFQKIMLTYNSTYGAALKQFINSKSSDKPAMESKLRNPLMDRMEILRNNFDEGKFIEMKYYMFKLGLKYNVRTFEIILDKIKSETGLE